MKIEANYLSIVLILLLTMLLTTCFANLINSSVNSTVNIINKRNIIVNECIYTTQYSSVKIILINKTCIGGIIDTIIQSGEVYSNNEYLLIKTSTERLVKIITREEIIIV